MAEGDAASGGGIVIFTLWYIFIAINYIIVPVFERRGERYQCKCRRVSCNSASNSCDIPAYDIDIRIPDGSSSIIGPTGTTIEDGSSGILDDENADENADENDEDGKAAVDIKGEEVEDVEVVEPCGDAEECLPAFAVGEDE